MKYRYNVFSKFTISKSDKIEITCFIDNKKLTLNYVDSIYEFLEYISKHIFFSEKEIEQFNISIDIIKLFVYYNIIDSYNSTSGIECKIFNQLTKNPNCLQGLPDYDYINHIYNTYDKDFCKILGSDFKILDNKVKNIDFSISKNSLNKIKSIRLQDTYNSDSNINILDIINLIFSKRGDKSENRFYFGSGGGLASVFPIVISKTGEIYIYDKFSQKCYVKESNNLRLDIANKGFVKCETNFRCYDYFIFLLSDIKKVTEKYGNKSYRLVFLEAGQISFLFRMFCAYFNKAQLEVQGFYDDIVMNCLSNKSIINKNKLKDILLLHTLALSK